MHAPVYGRDLPQQPVGTVLTLDCPTCEQQFQWLSEEGMTGPQTYCSKKCKNRGRKLHARTTRMALADLDPTVAATGKLRLLLCVRCEQMFGWLPLCDSEEMLPPQTCSLSCQDAMRARRRRLRPTEEETLRARRRAEHEANELRTWRAKALQADRDGNLALAAELVARIDARLGLQPVTAPPPVDEHTAAVAAASAAARELLLPATHCPTCNKVASPTKEAAKAAKRAIEHHTRHTNEVRYYRCSAGYWHWTSWV